MLIEFIQSRDYSGVGLRLIGELAEVDDKTAKQFIEQGFAKRHAASPQTKAKDKEKEAHDGV